MRAGGHVDTLELTIHNDGGWAPVSRLHILMPPPVFGATANIPELAAGDTFSFMLVSRSAISGFTVFRAMILLEVRLEVPPRAPAGNFMEK